MTFVYQLTEPQIEKIRSVYPTLKQVQAWTQVPWQAVAAVWTRESFSIASPTGHPGGPFQFDPPPSPARMMELLRFSSLNQWQKGTACKTGVNSFASGALLAACLLQEKAGGKLLPICADATVKEALYGYNGRAYGSADHSPYVMSGFDAAHANMHLVGSEPDGHGGREHLDVIDRRPGAFVVYKQLKERFP